MPASQSSTEIGTTPIAERGRKTRGASKTLDIRAAKDATAVRRIAEKTCLPFWSEGARV